MPTTITKSISALVNIHRILQKQVPLRFNLRTPGTQQVPLRFNLRSLTPSLVPLRLNLAPPLNAPVSAPYQPFLAATGPTIPTVFSQDLPQSSWYAVNGTTLDCQPTSCTSPQPVGNLIPTGSMFTLLFVQASSNTLQALQNGATVTMTFILYGGQTATGSVSVSSGVSGTLFQVTCLTLAPIAITNYVIATQFF